MATPAKRPSVKGKKKIASRDGFTSKQEQQVAQNSTPNASAQGADSIAAAPPVEVSPSAGASAQEAPAQEAFARPSVASKGLKVAKPKKGKAKKPFASEEAQPGDAKEEAALGGAPAAGAPLDFSAPADFFDLGEPASETTGGKASAKGRSRRALRERPSTSQPGAKDDADEAKEGAGATGRASKKTKAKSVSARVVLIVIAVIVVLALAVGGLFAWNTWFRFDDAADIQGEWRTGDGAVVVTIDGERINMPENISYDYTLDTSAKTIAISFANFTGGGSYAFSEDRMTFTVTEGEGDAVTATVFTKVSGNAAATPRTLSEEEQQALDAALAAVKAAENGENAGGGQAPSGEGQDDSGAQEPTSADGSQAEPSESAATGGSSGGDGSTAGANAPSPLSSAVNDASSGEGA